jgi:hypothetical protein
MTKCKLCMGSGRSSKTATLGGPCSLCNGYGERRDEPNRTWQCKICKGGGLSTKNLGEPCESCDGYGAVVPPDFASVPEEGPMVIFVEAGMPRTATLRLEEMFEKLSGEVRICDPYYGKKTLYRLDFLKQCKPIKFLTQKPDANESSTLPTALQVWKQEHGDVEFRRDSGRDLHDRYLLSDSELILLGHGLKDVGTKDSFIIRIGRDLAEDLILTVRESFDAKWRASTPIV